MQEMTQVVDDDFYIVSLYFSNFELFFFILDRTNLFSR